MRGVIALLFKKDAAKIITNYRPLTLLCLEYKILSKVITNRLATALPHYQHGPNMRNKRKENKLEFTITQRHSRIHKR